MGTRLFKTSLNVCGLVGIVCWSPLLSQTYTAPDGYYDAASGLSGSALEDTLHDIIDNHNVRSYDDFKLATRALDQDPDNPDNIILIYSGESFPANLFGTSGNVWNREHSWPQSYGVDPQYNTVGHSDMHHLFPCLAGVNSARSNLYFDWTDPGSKQTYPRAEGSSYDSNSWEPRDEDKGRIARAILYMATRYEGLSDEKVSSGSSTNPPDLKLNTRANSGNQTMGKLDVLLEWNRMFAPDEREQKRNHDIFFGVQWGTRTYKQDNRNPFVDHPEFADAIYTTLHQTYGAWRVQHFPPEELNSAPVSGDLADPDKDRLINLIELGANMDPRSTSATAPFTVTANPDSSVTLSYTRIKQAEVSGLAYAIEASTDPWNEPSWSTIAATPAVTGIDQWTEQASQNHNPQEPAHYRLKVTRSYPLNDPGSGIFDPARHAAVEGSIFAYEDRVVDNWRNAPWFGFFNETNYPWGYDPVHKWLRVHADSPQSMVLYDEHLGWMWSSATTYPIVYSFVKSAWIAIDTQTSEPSRKLKFVETGADLSEQDF